MANLRLMQQKAARDSAIARLNEISDIAQEAVENPNIHTSFKMRYSKLDSVYKSFESYHCKIISSTSIVEHNDLLEAEDVIRKNIDQKYFDIKSIYYDLFVDQGDDLNQSRRSAKSNFNQKLPQISLPSFSGDLNTWKTFLDLFTALVDENHQLTGIEKFQYLISCLSGEALSIVKGLPLSNDNYNIVFKNLKNRFDNKRLLATTFWQKIVNFPKIEKENITSLRELINTVNENLAALDNIGFAVDQWCFPLFNIILEKIDMKTRTRFELEHSNIELPTFEQLNTFLIGHCKAIESCSSQHEQPLTKKQFSNTLKSGIRLGSKSSFVVHTNQLVCIVCKKDHFITKCPAFIEKSPHARYLIVKEHKLCLNCLKPSHNLKNCSSTFKCRICNNTHHSLLHFEKISDKSSSQKETEENSVKPGNSLWSGNLLKDKSIDTMVLLSSAEIKVKDSQGNFKSVRVLLDNGSQVSLITDHCRRKLGLPFMGTKQCIRGVGDISLLDSRGEVDCIIRPRQKRQPEFKVQAFVVPKICSAMPTCSFSPSQWEHFHGLNLADPKFYLSKPIDMLLSAEIFAHILIDGKMESKSQSPVAYNSLFGWILSGKIEYNRSNTIAQSSFVGSTNIQKPTLSLEETLQEFWKLEEIPSNHHMSDEELTCEELYVQTTFRNDDGRYVVSLPFRKNSELGQSKQSAIQRFYSLENRMSKNSILRRQYVDFMQDYLDAGHMSPSTASTEPCYFIPHHCIRQHNSKFRVVFDASINSSNQLSLNDILLNGPKLQTDIAALLLRFRIHRIVFSADIRQMYRQILVHTPHRNFQKIVWRFSENDSLQEYTLNTLTYGVKSSPFLALRTIAQLCEDEGARYPLAGKILRQDVYVDDVFGGCEDKLEAKTMIEQLIALLSCGGFELRKWVSNQPCLLSSMPEDLKQSPVNFDNKECVKILGLHWNPVEDNFMYIVHPIERPCTKRNVLSDLARIFDPIGFLTPLTFLAKYFMQELWLLSIGWDDILCDSFANRYAKFKQELPQLSSLRIQRCLGCATLPCELHGFCDASERGYAAVVYLRVPSKNSSYEVFLQAGKSKVAPLKRVSIARLELCAAVLLTKLVTFVKSALEKNEDIHISNIFAWSDSTVALSWIKAPSYRWKTFVANRVSKIQETLSPFQWHFVSGNENPADIASRGVFASELLKSVSWWAGPAWLINPIDFEEHTSVALSELAGCEEKVHVLHCATEPYSILNIIDRFSSLAKIQRVLVYMMRFIARISPVGCLKLQLRSFQPSKCLNCTPLELSHSLQLLVGLVQQDVFSKEISFLSEKKSLPKSLRKLNPFLDEKGLVRVGGRLALGQLNYDTKFPILLPRKHRLTELIIRHFHEDLGHPGLRTLQFLISRQFWILAPRRAIRSVISKCYRCYRLNPKFVTPVMGNLPLPRISQVKPFSQTGCDFGGPFLIKMGNIRGAKRFKAYICLFVCMSTKAMHLELASDLSTECFLACFRRFISRRGRCSVLFSDCGTNFVGANRYLHDIFKDALKGELIEWRFNPPNAPHFGGLWEAGIKSVKTHLHRIIGEQILTYEEFYTVIVKIEALMNSRPLVECSSDANDLSVLTPGHFLTLEPITALPDPDLEHVKLNRLSRWQLLVRMQQDFWNRWHQEYLHSLQQRAKWTKEEAPDLEIGKVVILKDNNSPPLKWKLGRIIEMFFGVDGKCRVVRLKTNEGILKRPVVKIAPLPYSLKNSL